MREHAYLNGAVLAPSPRPDQRHANIMTDYPSAEALVLDGEAALREFGNWVSAFATVRRKVSAALALAHVAAGWCDATIGFDTKPWDVAGRGVAGASRRRPLPGLPLRRRAAARPRGALLHGHWDPGRDYPVLEESVRRIIGCPPGTGASADQVMEPGAR